MTDILAVIAAGAAGTLIAAAFHAVVISLPRKIKGFA